MPITAKSLQPYIVNEWKSGEQFGSSGFGETELTWIGRASYFDNGQNEQVVFAASQPESPVFGTEGGTGRGANIGVKAIPADLGAASWTYDIPGNTDNSRIPNSNGASSGYPLRTDDAFNVYTLGRADEAAEFDAGDDVSVLQKFNSSGALQWSRWNNSVSTGRLDFGVHPNGNVIVSMCSGTWNGETGGDEVIVLDGDGNTLYTYNRSDLPDANLTRLQPFGVNADKVLHFDNGLSGTYDDIFALDVADMEGTELWTFNKLAVNGFLTNDLNSIRKVICRPDGGLLIVPYASNDLELRFVSEDGVLEEELDLTSLFSGLGSNPSIRDVQYGLFGDIFVLAAGASGADILRLRESAVVPFSFSKIWAASDVGFGFAQSIAGAVALANEDELMNNVESLALNSNGVIFVGEGQTTGIDTGYVSAFQMAGNTSGGAWSLDGLWTDSPFDSLPRGGDTLWHHNVGSGRYPYHSGYDYAGPATQSIARAPAVDLTPFVNPDGSGERNADFWTVFVRLWYRINRNVPTLGGLDQQHDRLFLLADNGVDPEFEIGLFSNWDTSDLPPDFDPDASVEGAIELSRISGTLPGEFASNVFTMTGQPLQNEIVTIGSKVYRFREKLLPANTANDVQIGVNLEESLANLAGAINGGPGDYTSTTTPSTQVTAVSDATTLTVTAIERGTAANAFTSTDTTTNGTWPAVTLQGGTETAEDTNIGENGEWWFEQLMAPAAAGQELLLGKNVSFSLRCDVAETDATDYGIGIARFSVEILRGGVSEIATLRDGYAGVPASLVDFPVSLYKSWANSRRWR